MMLAFRSVHQPTKVFEFVKLIFRPLRSQSDIKADVGKLMVDKITNLMFM